MKNKSLILIIVLALILRLVGINHGFPFIFHADEPTIVRSALQLRFDPNPGHFDWPHLYIYLSYFLFIVFARIRDIVVSLGYKSIVSAYIPIMWNDDLIFYLLSRILSAVLGAFTVVPIYLTAKKFFNEKVGILSALSFAVIPFHVWRSHYALADVPMVFFLAWALYFASEIFTSESLKSYILSGFFVGLAASSKYNGGLSALFVPLAHFFGVFRDVKCKYQNKRPVLNLDTLLKFVLSGLAAMFGFFVGTPFSVFDYKTFMRTDGPKGALWQFKNVGSVPFLDHITKFFSEFVYKLPDDLGYVIIIGFAVMLFISLYKIFSKKFSKDDFVITFLSTIVIIFVYYVSGFGKSRSHYYMMFYPPLVIVFGYFLVYLSDFLYSRIKNFSILMIFLILSIPIMMSCLNTYRFFNGDTRIDLYNWLSSNLNRSHDVLYFDETLRLIFADKIVSSHSKFEEWPKFYTGYVLITPSSERLLEGVPVKLEKVIDFDGSLKNGPAITVYKFDRF